MLHFYYMPRFIKTGGIVIAVILCFYALQYFSAAIHFGCMDPKEDCPPPVYFAGELIYKTIIRPPWMKFGNE